MSALEDGHYWVRFGTSPHWDVMQWHDGHFWGTAGDGYAADCFEIGPRVHRPGEHSLQARVADWMQECFGATISQDKTERADRFVEEALELAQAIGWTRDRGHALVDYVFSRPVGEIGQEVGGVMVTLSALCNVFGVVIEMEAVREVDRITRPDMVLKIRAKQAAKPTGSALPIAVTATTHRHKTRGTEYVLVGAGLMQAEHWRDLSRDQDLVEGAEVGEPVDMREVVIYHSALDPNEIWVRPREEFEDGRFEAIAPVAEH